MEIYFQDYVQDTYNRRGRNFLVLQNPKSGRKYQSVIENNGLVD